MSPTGQMLKARWPIIAMATACCLLGGLLATVISPPRYDASARVTLNYLHSDPITGVYMDWKRTYRYELSQMDLITDLQVVGPAVQASGWLEDPDLLALYQARPPGDTRDLATWAAERVQNGIRASMVGDSNIMEITFRSVSPETARAVVSAVRDSYVDVLVRDRRSSALSQALAFQAQADRAAAEVIKLQVQKAAYEKASGVMMREDDVDLDTIQMLALTPSVQTPKFRYYGTGLSKTATDLAKIDSQIAAATIALGPNHPQLAAFKANRVIVAAALAAQAENSDARTSMASAQEAVRSERFDSQKATVMDRRDEVLKLRLMQDRINEKVAAFAASTATAVRMRQMSTMVESGVTPIGEAEVSPKRAFPNEPLIYGGAAALGLLGGIALAILTELFNLRVRTMAGLRNVVPGPVLGSVPTIRVPKIKPLRRRKTRSVAEPRLQSVGVQ